MGGAAEGAGGGRWLGRGTQGYLLWPANPPPGEDSGEAPEGWDGGLGAGLQQSPPGIPARLSGEGMR